MDMMKNNTLWQDDITKEISALEILGVFQYYPSKKKFENNDGWQWAQMRVRFHIKQKYFKHKARLVIREYVVESS